MNKNKEIKLKQDLLKLKGERKFNEAKKLALQLSKKLSNDIEIWFALGQLQAEVGEYKKAVLSYSKIYRRSSPLKIEALERALDLCVKHKFSQLGMDPAQILTRIKPESADAHFKHGLLWFELKHYLNAKKHFVAALKFEPENTKYLNQFGLLNILLGKPEESLPYFKKCQKLIPDDKYAYYFHLWALNYVDGIADDDIVLEHRKYAELLESKCPEVEPFNGEVKASNRLKVGFVSQDFKTHSVAYFFLPIIKNYSKENWEVFCYSDVGRPDGTTQKIRSESEHWCDSHDMTDRELYAQIRSDGIDILIDLVGIIGEGRLELFAMKAAPIQAIYLGYPNTSGLTRMDYRISDEWSDEKVIADQIYTEKLIRLKTGFLCFEPVSDAPAVSALPALNKNTITFGSFNIFQKISQKMLKVWAQILTSVPNSKLLIKTLPLVEDLCRNEILATFSTLGVSKDRIILRGWTESRKAHLDMCNQVDIHLDTFPYNGTTTTCETLWQGVPTVTLAGNNHRSRVGLSIMHQVDLHDWVAKTEQEYINIAVRKSTDLEHLGALRQSLREKVKTSPLLDYDAFISELERQFTDIMSVPHK